MHLDRVHAWQRGVHAAPVTIEWDLSNRCSLGCEGCHFAHTHTRGPLAARPKPSWCEATGDLADERVVLEGVSQAASAGVRAIVWSGGGEPLLYPSWRTVFSAARLHGLEQGLYTHGGLIGSDDARVLSTLTWAVVSLDAADRRAYQAYKGADGFDRACAGVRRLVESGVTTGASFLLWPGNWDHVDRMVALSRELGATYCTFRPLIQTDLERPDRLLWPASEADESELTAFTLSVIDRLGREPDIEVDLQRFLELRNWRAFGRGYAVCHGVKFSTTITPDGRVWLCPQRRGVADSLLGDLRVESFAAIWARHPGRRADLTGCRAMCRLHPTNKSAAGLFEALPREHTAFV